MRSDLPPFIDHAVLRPDAVRENVTSACNAALNYGFRGVVVPTGAVSQAKRILGSSEVKVIATVAFPHGTMAPDVKVQEASRAIALGADEIDYVICVGAALENDFHYLQQEAAAIVRAVRGKLVKAILEISYLPDATRLHAAKATVDGGVHYVKTSTGFGPGGGTTAEDVRQLLRATTGRALVKASGGIKEKWQAMELLAAGAAIIGSSNGPGLCAE